MESSQGNIENIIHYIINHFCLTFNRDKRLVVVKKEHIKEFAEPEQSLSSKKAKALLDLLSLTETWTEVQMKGCRGPILEAYISERLLTESSTIQDVLIEMDGFKSFLGSSIPGSILKQRKLIEELRKTYLLNPVVANEDTELVFILS
jgi:hypothetical protein